MSTKPKNDVSDLETQDKTQIGGPKNKTEGPNQALDPCLTQLSGIGSGQVVNLRNRTIRIGRDRDCDIWIEDPHISRTHAIIIDKDDETTLKDNNSTNGIYVNGKK